MKRRAPGESFIPIFVIMLSGFFLTLAGVFAQPTHPTDVKPLASTTTTTSAPAGAPLTKTVSPGVSVASRGIETWFLTVASNDYHAFPDWPLWHAVGICEQKGKGAFDTNGDGIAWHGSPLGGTVDSDYPGGLGESRDFWNTFRGSAGVTATNGALASPADQIRVARAGSQNGTHMRGWSSWTSGCVQREMSNGL